MKSFFALDTSNYTTSASLAFVDGEGCVTGHKSSRKLLPVPEHALGLRQSEAHFAHTKQLPDVMAELFRDMSAEIVAVGCSVRPRNIEGSYMPCFLAGEAVASGVALSHGVPFYRFSHQCGHIAAAAYSSGHEELIFSEHLAFHLSGGTTELLHVLPSPDGFKCEIISATLDISAGQLIDRAGVMMDLKFPCGSEIEKLALSEQATSPKISVTDDGMNFSGAQNKCAEIYKKTSNPASVARYAIDFVKLTIFEAARRARAKYPALPLVCAGGVMSNGIIREFFASLENVYFAANGLSSDNAVGIAVLTAEKSMGRLK